MPVSNTGLGLPRVFHDLVSQSALIVGDHGLRDAIWNLLDVQDCFHLSAVSFEVVIVKVRTNVHTAPPQWEKRVIEIDQVGVMLIDQVAGAIVEVLHKGHIRQRVEWVLYAVEALRVQPLPPLVFSLRSGQFTIVSLA